MFRRAAVGNHRRAESAILGSLHKLTGSYVLEAQWRALTVSFHERHFPGLLPRRVEPLSSVGIAHRDCPTALEEVAEVVTPGLKSNRLVWGAGSARGQEESGMREIVDQAAIPLRRFRATGHRDSIRSIVLAGE